MSPPFKISRYRYATGADLLFFCSSNQNGTRLQNFFKYGPSSEKFAHPWVKHIVFKGLKDCCNVLLYDLER